MYENILHCDSKIGLYLQINNISAAAYHRLLKLVPKLKHRHSPIYSLSNIQRTSDVGNGNHSVSLPIILIKIKVYQMLPSSYISSLMVSIL